MSWNALNMCKDIYKYKKNNNVKKQPCLYLQFFLYSLIFLGEDPVDRQHHKIKQTDITHKNNCTEDQELIHHYGECFCYINLYAVQNNHKAFYLPTGTLIIPINGFFKAQGSDF